MRVFATIVLVLGLIIAGVLVTASFQPKEYHVERSILTDASAPNIYSVISDFNRWPEWSPFQKYDPTMKMAIKGQAGAVGSSYSWEGNDQAGSGNMTLMNVQPDKSVEIKIEFLRPWPATNKVTFQIAEENDQRRITWAMDGKNDGLMPRVICLFMDMDKILGQDFEEGLKSLKELAERSSSQTAL